MLNKGMLYHLCYKKWYNISFCVNYKFKSEIGLPLRQICYYSPPEEVGVFSTEINHALSGLTSHTT